MATTARNSRRPPCCSPSKKCSKNNRRWPLPISRRTRSCSTSYATIVSTVRTCSTPLHRPSTTSSNGLERLISPPKPKHSCANGAPSVRPWRIGPSIPIGGTCPIHQQNIGKGAGLASALPRDGKCGEAYSSRWRTASKRRIAALTDTLSESSCPFIGMRMWASAAWRQGSVRPVASVPMTKAVPRRMSVS